MLEPPMQTLRVQRLAALLRALRTHHHSAELTGTGDLLRVVVHLTEETTLPVRCAIRRDDAERLWYMAVHETEDLALAEAGDLATALDKITDLMGQARADEAARRQHAAALVRSGRHG